MRHSRISGSVLALVLLAIACTPTGNAQSVDDRLARRIAEDNLVSTMLGSGKRFPFFVDQPKDWPVELRLALGLWTSNPGLAVERAKNLQFDLERTLEILPSLFDKPSHVENVLKVASNAASSEAELGAKWQEYQEGEELPRNDRLGTLEEAGQVVALAEQLRAAKNFQTTLGRMTSRLRAEIDRSPELAKPLREVAPVSKRLQDSRARVKTLLDQAVGTARGRRGAV